MCVPLIPKTRRARRPEGLKLWRQKDGASGMLRRVTYEKQVMVALSSSARVRSASASCGNCCA